MSADATIAAPTPGSGAAEPADQTAVAPSGMPALGLTLLGDADAAACEGDACLIPPLGTRNG